MRLLFKVLTPILSLLLLAACHSHRPATIEEHSEVRVKQKNKTNSNYIVRKGDTLSIIAFKYDLDHNDIAKWNGIVKPYVIYPGQDLRLSAPKQSTARNNGKPATVQITGIKTPAAATTTSMSSSKPPASKQTTTTLKEPEVAKTVASKPAESPVKKPLPAQTSKTTAQSVSADPQSWRWPANGRVLRGYVASNPSRNGLDIVGTEGQPIMATATGEVVYSGNGLLGYGELIIIKHSERMLSAYAHNKVRLVSEGEQVSAGQKVAEMGRNDQNEQLLHFEIRVHGKPVDPTGYLPKK